LRVHEATVAGFDGLELPVSPAEAAAALALGIG
jgi:hypothetical protein